MAHASASQLPYVVPSIIYVDTTNGFPGTSEPVGTPQYPVNNMADLVTICTARRIKNIHVKNYLVLDRAMLDYCFFGDMDWEQTAVWLNNQDVDGSTFNDLQVQGSSPGFITCTRCFVTGGHYSFLTWLSAAVIVGQLVNCVVGSVMPVPLSAHALTCIDCYAEGGPYNYFTTHNGGHLIWQGGSGGVTFWYSDNVNSLAEFKSVDTVISMALSAAGTVIINGAVWVYDASIDDGVTTYNLATYKPGNTVTRQSNSPGYAGSISVPANAGDVTVTTVLGTPYGNPVKVNSIIIRSNGATTVDFTSIGVYAGVAKAITLLTPAMGIRANLLTTGMLVEAVGPWILNAGETIIATLTGTGPTAVRMTMEMEFAAVGRGASLDGVDWPI